MEVKFYRCQHCGQIITVIKESGVTPMCCGEKMTKLVARSTDAAVEKHVPVWEVEDGKVLVNVGEVAHPMTDAHYIEWVALQSTNSVQIKMLKPGDEPKTCFALSEGEKAEEVYTYCNLHGLWK